LKVVGNRGVQDDIIHHSLKLVLERLNKILGKRVRSQGKPKIKKVGLSALGLGGRSSGDVGHWKMENRKHFDRNKSKRLYMAEPVANGRSRC